MDSIESYKILTVINSVAVICLSLISISFYTKIGLIRKILSDTTEILGWWSETVQILVRDLK